MRVPGSSCDAPGIDDEVVSDLASNSLAISSRIDVATKSENSPFERRQGCKRRVAVAALTIYGVHNDPGGTLRAGNGPSPGHPLSESPTHSGSATLGDRVTVSSSGGLAVARLIRGMRRSFACPSSFLDPLFLVEAFL